MADKQFGAHLVSYVHTLQQTLSPIAGQTLLPGYPIAEYISYNVVDDSGKKCKFVSNPKKQQWTGMLLIGIEKSKINGILYPMSDEYNIFTNINRADTGQQTLSAETIITYDGMGIEIKFVEPCEYYQALFFYSSDNYFKKLINKRILSIFLSTETYITYNSSKIYINGVPMRARNEQVIFDLLGIIYIPIDYRNKSSCKTHKLVLNNPVYYKRLEFFEYQAIADDDISYNEIH